MKAGAELGGWRLAGFSLPQIPLAVLGLPLAVYLPKYYADDLGVPLAGVGAAFLLVRLIDIGVDPVVGALLDRTHTRWGRFRPWLSVGAPIMMLGMYLLFMARPGVGVGYLLGALAVTYLGFSINVVGHFSWASTLSNRYDGRSRVFAWLQGVIVIGVLLALGLPAALAQMPGANGASGMRAMGWLSIVMTPLTLAVAFVAAKEPREQRVHAHAGVREYLTLLKNRTVLRLLAMDVSIQTGAQLAGVLFFFYVEQVKRFSVINADLLLIAYFIGALAATPLWRGLAARFGKHRALAIAALFFIVGQSAALLMPAGQFGVGLVVMLLAGLPYSAPGVLIRAMLADLGDQQRLDTGADRASLFYALQIGDSKVAAAFAVGVAFPLLAGMGFNATSGVTNSPHALLGLTLLFIAAPSVLGLISAALSVGYPLTAERHAELRAKLAERDAREGILPPRDLA